MKFTGQVSGLLSGLKPAIDCALTNGKREYDDAFKVMLTVSKKGLIAQAHNGYVALTNTSEGDGFSFELKEAGTATVKAADLSAVLGSFHQDDVVDVELQGNELIVSCKGDEHQTLPLSHKPITMTEVASAFDTEIKINRNVLLNAMERVLFAIGFEKFRPEFLYWKLHVEPGMVRSVCGDGARFAVYQIEGDNTVEVDSSLNLCIHREHNPVIQKLLKDTGEEWVTIKTYARKDDDDSLSDQIVIETGNMTMTLVGHDPGVKWPNEDKFLNRVNVNKYVTKISDWDEPTRGITATYNEDIRKQNEIHDIVLNFDTEKGFVYVKADKQMRALRKIKIQDHVGDATVFPVISTYVKDIYRNATKDDSIQFEFVNETSPAVVKFFASDKVSDSTLYRVNTTAGTKEQYLMFFASYSRK